MSPFAKLVCLLWSLSNKVVSVLCLDVVFSAVEVCCVVAEYHPSSTTKTPLAGRHKSPRDRAAPNNLRPRYTILSAAINRVSSATVTSASLQLLLLVAAFTTWHVVTSSTGSLMST